MSHVNITSVTDANFDTQVLGADRPVLVKFEAPWCGPCKAMKPMIDEIATEYGDKLSIVTLDIDSNNKTPHKYGIRGVPTLMLFDKGTVMAQKVGLQRKADVVALLQNVVDYDTPSP